LVWATAIPRVSEINVAAAKQERKPTRKICLIILDLPWLKQFPASAGNHPCCARIARGNRDPHHVGQNAITAFVEAVP
jgi:hypothetical protein